MNWHFKEWDMVTFNTVQSDLAQYNGRVCTVLRRLTEDEADLNETGSMYRICVGPCWADKSKRIEIDCFDDELTATEETMFVRMVDLYRALGYRMVAFEKEGEGGWLMAFDTNGINAETLPKQAFDIEPCRKWCAFLGWGSVTDDEVRIYDDTDDPEGMLGGYEYDVSRYSVEQLASY